jgi:hypothetical protein
MRFGNCRLSIFRSFTNSLGESGFLELFDFLSSSFISDQTKEERENERKKRIKYNIPNDKNEELFYLFAVFIRVTISIGTLINVEELSSTIPDESEIVDTLELDDWKL